MKQSLLPSKALATEGECFSESMSPMTLCCNNVLMFVRMYDRGIFNPTNLNGGSFQYKLI